MFAWCYIFSFHYLHLTLTAAHHYSTPPMFRRLKTSFEQRSHVCVRLKTAHFSPASTSICICFSLWSDEAYSTVLCSMLRGAPAVVGANCGKLLYLAVVKLTRIAALWSCSSHACLPRCMSQFVHPRVQVDICASYEIPSRRFLDIAFSGPRMKSQWPSTFDHRNQTFVSLSGCLCQIPSRRSWDILSQKWDETNNAHRQRGMKRLQSH